MKGGSAWPCLFSVEIWDPWWNNRDTHASGRGDQELGIGQKDCISIFTRTVTPRRVLRRF